MHSLNEIQNTDAFKIAISQGAGWFSAFEQAFYRPGCDGLEVAKVDKAGNLGEWERDWRHYPPEHAVRL